MVKTLVLRIYNSTPIYDAMKKLHIENDESIFVTFNPDIDTEWKYTESERLIEVRGHESYIPGILDKTVVAMRACLQLFDFDFLVRSNASTVIDTVELHSQLSSYSRDIHFCSGHTWPMEWINGDLQFTTVEWLGKGLPLITGIAIVMSRVTCQYIVDNENLLDKSRIDDVSIALMLEKLEKVHLNMPRSEEVGIVNGVCFYRFRTDGPKPWLGIESGKPGRTDDVISIEKQYKLLAKKNLLKPCS